MLVQFAIDAIRRGAANAKTPPPSSPENLVLSIPIEDAPDTSADNVDGDLIADIVGSTFAIQYVDSKGSESRRRITVRSIRLGAASQLLIRAYCHERQAARTFRGDRIQEIIDLQTGEILDSLQSYFSALAIPTSTEAENDTQIALSRCRAGIQMLVFLARCDGEYHPTEHSAVLAYVADKSPDLDLDRTAVDRHVRALHPDIANFYTALDYFADDADEDDAEQLLRYAIHIVEADGVISTEEFDFLAEIRDAFADAGRSLAVPH